MDYEIQDYEIKYRWNESERFHTERRSTEESAAKLAKELHELGYQVYVLQIRLMIF